MAADSGLLSPRFVTSPLVSREGLCHSQLMTSPEAKCSPSPKGQGCHCFLRFSSEKPGEEVVPPPRRPQVGEGQWEALVTPIHTFLQGSVSSLLGSPCLWKRPSETDRWWQHLGYCCLGSKWLRAAAGGKKLLAVGRIIRSSHLHSPLLFQETAPPQLTPFISPSEGCRGPLSEGQVEPL